jgi:capsular exopolysaccharide synthesis family protein
LTSLLIQQLAIREVLQNAGTNLFVLASGPTPPNPSELLASTYVRDVVHSLLDIVDYVVLDTAPLLPVADGSEVAAMAEGTLLVARHKVVTDPQVRRAMTALTRVNARVLGVLLNDMPARSDSYGYGYTYYRADPRSGDDQTAESGRSR